MLFNDSFVATRYLLKLAQNLNPKVKIFNVKSFPKHKLNKNAIRLILVTILQKFKVDLSLLLLNT